MSAGWLGVLVVLPALPLPLLPFVLPFFLRFFLAWPSSWPRNASPLAPSAARPRRRSAPRRLWVWANVLVTASNRVVAIVVSFSPSCSLVRDHPGSMLRSLGERDGARWRGQHSSGVRLGTGQPPRQAHQVGASCTPPGRCRNEGT